MAIRSCRRFKELPADAGQNLEDVARDMQKRDQDDSSRDLAPLKPAPDAIFIDSTYLTIDQVVAKMMDSIQNAC